MTVFIIIGFAGFLSAALLTGTFVSGDQQRANFYTETKEDRRTRSKLVD